MRPSTRAYVNAALVPTNVIASILLVELGGHRLAAELSFKFLRDQHLVPLETNAS